MKAQIKLYYENNPELPDSQYITNVKAIPRRDELVYFKGSVYRVKEIIHDTYFDQVKVFTQWEDKTSIK